MSAMSTRSRRVLAIVSAAFFSSRGAPLWAAAPCQPPLVLNPSFETVDGGGAPVHWQYAAAKGGSQDVTTVDPFGGAKALRLVNSDGGQDSWRGAISDYIAVEPMMEYVLSARIKSQSGSELVYLGWQEFDADKNPLQMSYFALLRQTVTTQWAPYQGARWTSAQARYVKVRLFGPYESTGTVWWDTISLRPENLLANAGFEEGLNGSGTPYEWAHAAGPAAQKTLDASQSSCGTYSWKMTSDDPAAWMGMGSRLLPVDAQADYLVSVDVKSAAGTEWNHVGWTEFDANKIQLGSPAYFVLDHQVVSTTWTTYQRMHRPLSPQAAFVQIRFFGPSLRAGTVWWDNIFFGKKSRMTLARRVQKAGAATAATIRLAVPEDALALSRLELRVKDKASGATVFERTFSAPPESVSVDIPGLPEGVYVVSAELAAAERATPLWTREETLYSFGPRPKEIPPSGDLKAFGVSSMARFLYDVFDTAQLGGTLEMVKNQGFNVVEISLGSLQAKPGFMDEAGRLGLKVLIFPATVANKDLPALIAQYKGHPALLGWYTTDEPVVAWTDAFLERYATFRREDPDHLIITEVNGTGMPFWRDLIDGMDIAMSDPYPVPQDPITDVADWTDAARQAAAPQAKPTFTTLASFGNLLPRWPREPTPQENRAMTYLSIVHGATGLGYWSFVADRQTKERLPTRYPALWDSFAALNRELEALSPAILEGTAAGDISDNRAGVRTLLKTYRNKRYLVAVNVDPQPTQASFTLAGPSKLGEIRELAGESTYARLDERTFLDAFPGYGVHVYEITLEAPYDPPIFKLPDPPRLSVDGLLSFEDVHDGVSGFTVVFTPGDRTLEVAGHSASIASLGLLPGQYTLEAVGHGPLGDSAPATAVLTLVAEEARTVRAYPSPWVSSRHSGQPVTFDGLAAQGVLNIYTISGARVRALNISEGKATWDLKNQLGAAVPPGIYIYAASGRDRPAKGRLAVIK